jgi:hypothetical protein
MKYLTPHYYDLFIYKFVLKIIRIINTKKYMILPIPHPSKNTLNKKLLCNLDLELERMTIFLF